MQRFKWLVLLCAFVVLWSSPGLADNEVAQVAQIGDTKYNDLASAVTAAGTDNVGTEIKLLADIELTATQEIKKNLTIDLDGHNITATGVRALWIKNGEVTITNTAEAADNKGIISANGEGLADSSSVIRVGDGDTNSSKAKLTIGENVTVSTTKCYGVTVFGKNNTDNNLETADIEFVLNETSKIIVTEVEACAVSGNGSSNLSATTITIDGSIESGKDYAIYHPGSGTLTINGTVKGLGGIEAKGGEATIGSTKVDVGENATVEATATDDDLKHEKNTNGTSTAGFAIAAVNNTSYKGGVKINIASGAIKGYLATINDNASVAEEKKASITVSGGVFDKNPTEKVTKDGITPEAAAVLAEGKAVVKLKDNTDYPYAVTTAPTVSALTNSGGELTGAYTKDSQPITLTATFPTDKVSFGNSEYEIEYTAKWYKGEDEISEGVTTEDDSSKLEIARNVNNNGSYTCKLSTAEKELTAPAAVEVNIEKVTPTVTISGAANLTYNKNAQNLLADTPSTTFGTLTYSLAEIGEYVETIPTGTNAGDYTVYYKVAADDNGNWEEKTGNVTVSIAKANVTLEDANKPKAAENLTYTTGSALNLVTAGTAIGGVGDMQYALGDATEFTTAIPAATNAGTYTVKYKTAANDNYNESAIGTVEVTIAKATFTGPELPSGLTAEYGKTLADVNIQAVANDSGTWSWETVDTTKVGNVDGTNSFKAKFTLNENTAKNYQFDGEATSKTFDVTVAVTAKEVELTWSDTTSLIYNGTDKTPTASVTGGGLIEGDTLTPTVTVTSGNATEGKAINAGSYTATATLPTDVKNYKLKDGTTTAFTIEPVTISSIGGIKVKEGKTVYEYNGSTEVELDCAEATFDGKVEADTVSITAKGTLDDANVGENKAVTVAKADITLTDDSENYKLADEVSVTNELKVTITPKALTVSNLTATDREYDGTMDVTLDISKAELSDMLDADNGKVSIESATGTVEDANASETAKTVTVSEVKLTGNSANNYTVDATTIADITVTISKKSVSVSGITAKDKVYNGNPNVELDYASAVFDGLAEGESNPTITATGTAEDADAGENKKVTISDLALDSSVTNYKLATDGNQTGTTATISPKEVTLTWSDTEFDYDSSSHAPSATVGGLVDNETGLSVTVDGAAAEVGTHTATAKDLTAGEGVTAKVGNYTLPENPTTTFTIKAAKLADDAITTEPKEAKTTTSETGASKTSKETTFTLKLGDGDGEVISVDVAITTDEVFAAKVNEKFSTLVSVDVSLDLGTGIAKKQFSHYVYSIDIVAPEWLNEKSGVLSSDDVANGPYHHEFTVAGTPTTVKNDPIVFTAHIMLSSDNYSNVLTASVDKTVEFNVEKGTVVNPTVTIKGWTYGSSSNAPKVEGANEGTYKITYKVKGADDSTSTDKAPTNTGDYTVTVVIPSTDDYEGKTVSADFTIAQLEAKLAWSATSFTYNSGDQAPTATVSNLVEGDTCAVTVTVSGDKATDGKAVNAGSYTATATALANANYKLPTSASTAFTIAKADITPSVTIADWAHGATASTPVISGNTGNGTVTYLYKSQSGTTAYESATAPTSAGSYTLTITIAETDNYNGGTAEASFKITGGTAPTEDNTGTGSTGETEKTTEELVEEAVNEDGTISDDVMAQLIENVATETAGELTPEDIAKNTAVVNVLANSVSNTNNTTNELNLSSIALTSTKGIAALLTAVQTGSGVNTSEMTLNLSKNSDLSQVSDLSGVEVKSLNLEGNTSVKTVDLKGATITGTLNMKGMGGTKGATETKATVDLKNAKVDTVDMSDSAVGTLTLDPSSDVKTIQASGSDLADINLAGNENIESLDISETEVTKLDAAGCAGLTNLTAAGSSNGTGKLKKIDISGCSSLTELTVSRNQLFGIKGHGLTSVRTFKARGQKVSNPSASTVFRRSMNFWEFLWNLWRAIVIDDIANGNTDETDPGEYVEGTSSKDIAPFDVEDIASVYDPNNTSNDATPDADGMINFTTTPNGIKYDYVPDFPNAGLAGFITAADEDSENGMDVEVSDGTTEEEATLGNSSGGGCDAGFGLGALSALMLVFATLKKRR